ncbi:MAG: glycosyltransferase [Deltaproteobacteria bacterium]|nr:glycosyltransferase [Deltaproteobacteria bacterium]
MTTPITVLMTVYNNGKYLREAIQSVLAQTFRDFEFLIIDDASQDNSVEIIKEFEDKRIRLVLQEKNLGQTPSLNHGLELAKGEYVARIDADDIAHPERIEKQFEFAKAAPANFAAVGACFTFIDSNGRSIFSPKATCEATDMVWHLLFTSPIAHPSAFLKKEAVVSVGGYDPRFRYVQDQILWTRLLFKNFGIYNMEGLPLMQVRLHPDSATHKGKEAREKEAVLALKEVLESLFGFKIDAEEAKDFHNLMTGSAPLDKQAKEKSVAWLQKCYQKLLPTKAIALPWGRTLLRLALFGKNVGFSLRLRFLFWAVRDNGLHIFQTRSLSQMWQGLRYFILLRRAS